MMGGGGGGGGGGETLLAIRLFMVEVVNVGN